MKILTSLLSRQKKPAQDDETSSESSGVASRSHSSSPQTYIPAASYANSTYAKSSYAATSSAAAPAAATATATTASAASTVAAPEAVDTVSAPAASESATSSSAPAVSAAAPATASSDSVASASSSRTAAAMARASAAAARLSAASRADYDSDTAAEAASGDAASEHSSRRHGHAYLASLIASNAASANAKSSADTAASSASETTAAAHSAATYSASSSVRVAASHSSASDAAGGLAGSELHSRFERSSNFAPRANDSLKDLSEVASNRNRGAVHRAAQHMAMINQRSQETSVDESTETTAVAAQNHSITTSEVGRTESSASTDSSSAVTASNSSVTSSSTSYEKNQSKSLSNSQSNDESSGSPLSYVSSSVSGSSSSLSSSSVALSGSSSDYDLASNSSEEAVTSESAVAATNVTAEHNANASHETSSATESNHTAQAANRTSSDQESVVQTTTEHHSSSVVHDSATATDTTDVSVVSSSAASEATASSNEVAKPKHRMTLRKQIKRIRPTEDNQSSTESTASKSTTTDTEIAAHAGDDLGNSTTASMSTATVSISNVATSASAANATKHAVATANTVVSNDDCSLEAYCGADLVEIPDDRQRARDDRAVVEQLLSEYKIEKLTDWDSDVEPAVAGDKVIKVACNIEQAVRLCGHNDSDCHNNLSHIDSYVRLCEDRFLGRRYAKNANFALNKTFEVEESYLGDTFHFSERKEHTILELLQVLAYQDANAPFVASAINDYGQVNYESYSRFRLRRILFNNPFLNSINFNGNLNDNDCWNTWVEQYNTLNADDPNGLIGPTTIAKFKEHFGNFANFEKAINLMRSWLIDYDSKRQWTTMFLFPFGANALYKEIDKNLSSNTTIFSGQGDVVFSMLQRASKSPYLTATQAQQLLSRDDLLEIIRNAEVSPSATPAQPPTVESSSQDAATSAASTAVSDARAAASAAATNTSVSTAMAAAKAFNAEKLDVGKELVHRFFNDDDVINIFAGFINDSELDTADHSCFCTKYKTSFLPYVDLPVFERLKEDFTNLLYCPLNKQKLFIALARMATLNLLVYLLEQEQKMCICFDYSKKALRNGGLASQATASAAAATAATAADAAVAGEADEVERAMAELAGRYDITMPVCAKGNKDNKDVKRISKERQLFNNGLFDDSRKSFVLHRAELYLQLTVPFLRHKPQLSTEEGNLVKRIICAAFNYNSENEDKSKKKGSSRKKLEWDMRNCSTIIETMLAKALNRETHMSGLNSHLAAQCGLSKPTKTGKANYEMSDELLRTLVMAVLGKEECMKLSRFLDIIRERYHIVIGPTESNHHQSREELENSTDHPNFEANLTQLKLQLHRLDMLINLSDYCEYIRRP